jgi:hypothetical protein
MEDTDRKFEICTLKSQIDGVRQVSGALAGQFERAGTGTEKMQIARTYSQTLKALHAMQYLLRMWERRERKSA